MPVPKYHQIYLVLREQLNEGRFADGVPGEVALTGQFGVARVTVRRALERLSSEGLISRNPGRVGRTVLVHEVLPREDHACRGVLADPVPGRALRARPAVPVGVDDDGQLVVAGVERLPLGDHRRRELVQHQHLLRQRLRTGEGGEPRAGGVDLRGRHRADLGQVLLAGGEAPLGVEGEPDVGVGQQGLVALRLREEVGGAGLQVEQHVDALLARGLHPRLEEGRVDLVGVVAVLARLRRSRPW